MRWKRKHFRSPQRSPFQVVRQHAGPHNAIGDAKLSRQFAPARRILLLGTGHHELQIEMKRRDFAEGANQQVAAFLFVNATEEQNNALAAALRKPLKK